MQAMLVTTSRPKSSETAIGQDQMVQEITIQAWVVKHEGDCLWRIAEWLLGTCCGEESPATLHSVRNKIFCRKREENRVKLGD